MRFKLFFIILTFLMGFNQFLIWNAHATMIAMMRRVPALEAVSAPTASVDDLNQLYQQMIAHGMPSMSYGAELAVNFDQAQQSMNILESYDRGDKQITLTGEPLKRYIGIGEQTSCEYCCGAKSLVFPDGKPACGCAHSAAMRGLVAYLLQTRGGGLTNAQILDEVNRWKGVFFPKQTMSKILQSQGKNPTSLGLPNMVGGC